MLCKQVAIAYRRAVHGQLSARRCCVEVYAAKKDKKPAQKKGGSALSDLLKKKKTEETESIADAAVDTGSEGAATSGLDTETHMLLLMICQSYWQSTGRSLFQGGIDFEELPKAMYNAPFALLAHDFGVEGVTEPRFIYANKVGLEVFEGSWSDIVGWESKHTGGPSAELQAARNGVLEATGQNDWTVVDGVWRYTRKGNKVQLRSTPNRPAVLFTLKVKGGEDSWGQAVMFEEFVAGDGRLGRAGPGGVLSWEEAATPEAVGAAEASVKAQADAVRQLKEGRGLSNEAPQVQSAVAELKARKAALERLQARLADWEKGEKDRPKA